MLSGVDRLYNGGLGPCVLASLLQSAPDSPVGKGVSRIFADWIAAIANALRQAGASKANAERNVFRAALAAAREELRVSSQKP